MGTACGGLVESPHAGGQPGEVVGGMLPVEGGCDLIGHVVDRRFHDRPPEGFFGSVPVVDESVPHSEALVELSYGHRLVAQFSERLQAALKDLLQIGQWRVSRRPAWPAPSPCRPRRCHGTSL